MHSENVHVSESAAGTTGLRQLAAKATAAAAAATARQIPIASPPTDEPFAQHRPHTANDDDAQTPSTASSAPGNETASDAILHDEKTSSTDVLQANTLNAKSSSIQEFTARTVQQQQP